MSLWQDIRKASNVRTLTNFRSWRPDTIQSQYSGSQNMMRVMGAFNRRINPRPEIMSFYRKYFNIYTAGSDGLDRWGERLGIDRIVEDNQIINGKEVVISHSLPDEHYRTLLLYKASANIGSEDIATLNTLLSRLRSIFSGFDQAAYVLETGTMAIRYVFEDWLEGLDLAVFKKAGTLAKGQGVGWEMYAINPGQVMGYDGSGMHPLNQAPFAPDKALIVGEN